MAAEAQPVKLRKVGGYHLGANDEHAAVLTPPKGKTVRERLQELRVRGMLPGLRHVIVELVRRVKDLFEL